MLHNSFSTADMLWYITIACMNNVEIDMNDVVYLPELERRRTEKQAKDPNP